MTAKNFAESFTEVKKLVENFHKHIDEYLKPKYQEAEVRQDFLDKFFVALGWMLIITKIKILMNAKLKSKIRKLFQ